VGGRRREAATRKRGGTEHRLTQGYLLGFLMDVEGGENGLNAGRLQEPDMKEKGKAR